MTVRPGPDEYDPLFEANMNSLVEKFALPTAFCLGIPIVSIAGIGWFNENRIQSVELQNLVVGTMIYLTLATTCLGIPVCSIAGAIYLVRNRFRIQLLTLVILSLSIGALLWLNRNPVHITLSDYDAGWPIPCYSTMEKFGGLSFGMFGGTRMGKGDISPTAMVFDVAQNIATLLCIAFVLEIYIGRHRKTLL